MIDSSVSKSIHFKVNVEKWWDERAWRKEFTFFRVHYFVGWDDFLLSLSSKQHNESLFREATMKKRSKKASIICNWSKNGSERTYHSSVRGPPIGDDQLLIECWKQVKHETAISLVSINADSSHQHVTNVSQWHCIKYNNGKSRTSLTRKCSLVFGLWQLPCQNSKIAPLMNVQVEWKINWFLNERRNANFIFSSRH